MFTPPPSPSPPTQYFQQPTGDYFDHTIDDAVSPVLPSLPEAKRVTAQRTKWAVLAVPLVLVLITLTTRYLTHPTVLDVLSGSRVLNPWSPTSLTDWRLHKRHPSPQNQAMASSSPSITFPTAPPSSAVLPAATSTPPALNASTQTVPLIPSVPPSLPSPFPQAFDTPLEANFSTVGCQNFFTNMTNSDALNSCRSFSLLLQNSQAFNEAESNLTALNSILWATCNTDLGQETCSSNMAWFASALQSACSTELSAGNVLTAQTLQGLQAFDMMYTAGCLPDQSTNAYCFVDAAHATNPSDIYFFQLPMGISLPNNTTPSCSSCTKSLMALYAQSLENASKGTLANLEKTYSSGQKVAVAQCGASYAQALTSTSGAVGRGTWSAGVSLTAILLTWMMPSLVP